MTFVFIFLAIIGGALWRRWLGMAEENRHMRYRSVMVIVGIAWALLVIALPAWNWWAIPIAVAPVLWLISPAEWSNFWISDILAKAPWQWPKWWITETAGPRPWAEFVAGALGFGAAAVGATLLQ